MKVFWSWQSDTPGKIGRHFVKTALVDSLAELKHDPSIEDSHREDGLHLDHDIQGTTGSPDLVNTILAKIDASAVFVADVTSVGCVVDSDGKAGIKKLVNSNVGIELGYALRALGASKILLVFNEHFGTHEDMPFDLRHKGGAITFKLAPDADKASIQAQAKNLRSRFVNALKPLLQDSKVVFLPEFQPAPSTFCRAAYFERGEALANRIGDPEDNEDLYYVFDRPMLFYVRLFPTRGFGSDLSNNTLATLAQDVPLFEPETVYGGRFQQRNRFGVVAWLTQSNPPRGKVKIRSAVQLFQTGEIWAISTQGAEFQSPPTAPKISVPFVASLAFEKLYVNSVSKIIDFSARAMAANGPWRLICGLSGAKDRYMAVPDGRWGRMAGPFYEDDIEVSTVLKDKDPEGVDAALVSFFRKVWDRAGASRPRTVNGFPHESVSNPELST